MVTPSDDTELPTLTESATPSRRPSLSSLPQFQESRRSTPAIPPGLESEVASRRGTPTIPPGFSKPPSALPDLEGTGSRPSSRASLRRAASGQIIPAIPLRPGTPGETATPSRSASRAASPAKKADDAIEQTPTKKSKSTAASKLLDQQDARSNNESDSKQSAKENEKPTSKPGFTKAPRSVADVVKSKKTDKDDKKDANTDVKTSPLDAVEQQVPTKTKKGKVVEEKKPVASAASQAAAPKEDAKTVPATPSKADNKIDTTKRKHPGKLDIAAAVEKPVQSAANAASTSTPADVGAALNKQNRIASQPTSGPSMPASPNVSISSPAYKTAPRTLRVVPAPAPKVVETPPAVPAAPTPPVPAAGKLPSRKPSVTSMNFPGTPSSEHVSMSDNMSMTSASQSRANSPPPPGVGRVGSAPIREKTKSQQKKGRKELAKQKEEEEKAKLLSSGNAIPEEPAQEAIVSRQKKVKKEKAPKPVKPKQTAQKVEPTTTDTTPTVSRPASPAPVEKEVPAPVETPAPAPAPAPTPAPARTPPMPMQSPHEPSPPPTPTMTAAQFVSEMRLTRPEIQKSLEALFRTSSFASYKPSQSITAQDINNPASWQADFNIKLTREEIEGLRNGDMRAVQYGGEEGRIWDRGMVTPSGAHLRAMSAEHENRYLELEAAIANAPEEFRWRPTKPQNETHFPSFDLEALKREIDNAGGRGVSAMEAMVQDGSSMKKGAFLVDEASRYINEFVMPPATPPPSVGGGSQAGGQAQAGAQQGQASRMDSGVLPPMTVEEAEKQWAESRKETDEREAALKKSIKKNKKSVGM